MMNRDELAQQYLNQHLVSCPLADPEELAKKSFEFADAMIRASGQVPSDVAQIQEQSRLEHERDSERKERAFFGRSGLQPR